MGLLVPDGEVKSALFVPQDDGDHQRVRARMKGVFEHVRAQGNPLYAAVCSISQVLYLLHLARSSTALHIGEVGFNIGFSSIAFLESSPITQVVSFELSDNPYVNSAKEFIDARYPNRHHLVKGDSVETLPKYLTAASGEGFDFFFIDGSHEYPFVRSDIRYGRDLARAGGIVVVDDLTPWYPWGIGPTTAWEEAVRDNIITPLEYISDGIPVDIIEGPADRAWGVGRFLH